MEDKAGGRGRCALASVDMEGTVWCLCLIQTTESPVGKGLVAKPRGALSRPWGPPYLLHTRILFLSSLLGLRKLVEWEDPPGRYDFEKGSFSLELPDIWTTLPGIEEQDCVRAKSKRLPQMPCLEREGRYSL